jgi:hypothetical protein
VIRHENVSVNSARIPHCRIFQGLMVETVVCVGEKHRLTVVAALDQVYRLSWYDVTMSACHKAFLCDGWAFGLK